MTKLIITGLTAGTLVFAFFLLEPIIRYNFGWNQLPHTESTQNPSALEELASSIHQRSGAPAISIAVGKDGDLIWATAIGLSHVEQGVSADTNTSFRIGSVSKAVTSIGLGFLLERKLLAIDSPVSAYLPEYPYKAVTIRHLAAHTSGIRNYGLCFCIPMWEYYNNDHYTSIQDAMSMFVTDPLLFDPGADFSYSTYNYTVLSAVMEAAAGQDFIAFMDTEVFTPSGMHATHVDHQASTADATYYDIDNGSYKEVFPVNNSHKIAGGGISSSPSDLVRLGNRLLAYELLDSTTLAALFTPQKLSDGSMNPQNYAMGWRVGSYTLDDSTAIPIFHHGGTAMGSTAFWLLMPQEHLTVAITMNRTAKSFELHDYANQVVKLILADPKKTEK